MGTSGLLLVSDPEICAGHSDGNVSPVDLDDNFFHGESLTEKGRRPKPTPPKVPGQGRAKLRS